MDTERITDFIKFAIDQERLAAELYGTHAASATSRPAQQLLEEMAAVERGHEAKLTALLATGMASFPNNGEVRDLHVSDFMVLDELAPDAALDAVFVFAMKAEQKAHDLYASLASLESDDATRDLLQSMAEEESKHKRDLEEQYERGFMSDM